tara:strand:+ start:893 stop:1570 length:678 start_codon:yes stop_codon:yes gene_type:complete
MALNLDYSFVEGINVNPLESGEVPKCPQSRIDPPLPPDHPARNLWLVDYDATYDRYIATSIAEFYTELSSEMANGNFSNVPRLADIDAYLTALSAAIGNHRAFLQNLRAQSSRKKRGCASRGDLDRNISLDSTFKNKVDDAIVANEAILGSAEMSMEIFYDQGAANLEYEQAVAETNEAIAQANSQIALSDFSIAALNIKLGTKRLVQIALVAVALFYAYKMIRK